MNDLQIVEEILMKRTDISVPHIHTVATAILEALPKVLDLKVTYEESAGPSIFSVKRASSIVIEVRWQGEMWRITTPAGDNMATMERL